MLDAVAALEDTVPVPTAAGTGRLLPYTGASWGHRREGTGAGETWGHKGREDSRAGGAATGTPGKV